MAASIGKKPRMTTTRPDNDALLGQGLHTRRLRLSGDDLVWLRSLLEAYDGLGFVVGEGGGVVHVVTTTAQAATLDELLNDLQTEASFQLL